VIDYLCVLFVGDGLKLKPRRIIRYNLAVNSGYLLADPFLLKKCNVIDNFSISVSYIFL
jgi:hypothetical protein